jgi:hypothetical protein
MKKIRLFLLLSLLSIGFLVSYSQSLQVHNLSGTDVSTSVVDVWGDSAYTTIIAADFDVKNISAATVNIRAKKIENSLQTGSANTFCFAGQCFLSSVDTSTTIASIASGAIDTTFAGDYKPKGHLGASIITYVFFRTDISTDTAFVIVQFNATPAGLEQYATTGFEISSPYPNPASTHASFNYSFPDNASATFTLSDITGNIIKEIPIYNTKGTLEISTADLNGGMYFYSFYLNGVKLMTKKLIVQ